jgi:hypothetical protein
MHFFSIVKVYDANELRHLCVVMETQENMHGYKKISNMLPVTYVLRYQYLNNVLDGTVLPNNILNGLFGNWFTLKKCCIII